MITPEFMIQLASLLIGMGLGCSIESMWRFSNGRLVGGWRWLGAAALSLLLALFLIWCNIDRVEIACAAPTGGVLDLQIEPTGGSGRDAEANAATSRELRATSCWRMGKLEALGSRLVAVERTAPRSGHHAVLGSLLRASHVAQNPSCGAAWCAATSGLLGVGKSNTPPMDPTTDRTNYGYNEEQPFKPCGHCGQTECSTGVVVNGLARSLWTSDATKEALVCPECGAALHNARSVYTTADTSVVAEPVEQYRRIKPQYRDALLILRDHAGYLMLYRDAEKAATVLGVGYDGANRFHIAESALSGVLDKLVAGGHRVAVVIDPLVNDPRNGKQVDLYDMMVETLQPTA